MGSSKPRFYILHGDDEFTLNQQVNRMRADMHKRDSAGLNLAEFNNGAAVTAADVLSAVSAFPFLADRRLVIVRGMLAHITRSGAGETGKREVKRLLDDLPALPETARLVFVEHKKLPTNSKLLKLAQSDPHGYEKEFNATKNPTSWLMNRARKEYDTELEPDAAAALASVIGGDLRRADSELFKLANYTNGAPINRQTVIELTPYTAEESIWEMIDAVAAGQGQRAMTLLHTLLASPNEDPFRVWGMVIRQFRLMLLAKDHLEKGGSPATLADALGVSPYPAKKLPGQVRALSLANLETIYRKLLDYDTRIKTGRMDILLALDVLVATIAR
jgi:DNA polymerase III subunit delta